ncbi:MAG: ABC transporter permease [Lachnospiraceae bacterium]
MSKDKEIAKAEQSKVKKKSRAQETWRRFKKNKLAVFGMVLFFIILLVTLLADVIVSYDVSVTQVASERLQGPSASHWFGTDNYGRDLFARIIHGARNSLLVGFGSVIIGVTIGGLLGAVCGYLGGRFDAIVMRILDSIMCIPSAMLALAIVAALGTSLWNVLMAMTISNVPRYCRIIRSSVLGVTGQTYIEAAHSCGAPDFQIILKHVLPNAIGPIIVESTMAVGSAIISAAGISFVGMGIQPPAPEWGAMLNEAKTYMTMYPYMVLFPGLAIGFTALSMNLMGDGLRDALDPKLKN